MRTNHSDDKLEQAIRARLARLATAPVDTARLECQLEEAMTKIRSAPVARLVNWWIPIAAAVAAIVVISATVNVRLLEPDQVPIAATPSLIAGLHHEVITGGPFTIPVANIEQATQAIAVRWSDAPALPMPADCEVMSCCIHHVEGRKVACMLLRLRGKLITMVVAHTKDLTRDDSVKATQDNQRYAVYTKGNLNMVCMQHNGISVWLVGEFPHKELAQLLPKKWMTS